MPALRTYQEHQVNIARARGISIAIDTRYGMFIGVAFCPWMPIGRPAMRLRLAAAGRLKKKRLPFVTF